MPVLAMIYTCLTADVNAQDAGAISSAIDSIAREHGIPSVAFAVVNRDSIIVADAIGLAAGYEDPERGVPATSRSVYRVGSVTKTFIALGIMHLVYEGKLDLEDRLSDIVPEVPVKNRWEESHTVRLRHLLEHTTGFRDLFLADFAVPEGTPLPDLKDAVMREPDYWVSRWQPGTRCAYSNPGYSLLGYIIEKFSGKPYNEYLEDILLRPLGMRDSDFLGRNSERLAMSYDRQGNLQTPLPIMDHPAGYLHSTSEDMARFIRFMLVRGATDQVSNGPGVTDQLVDRPGGTGHERGTGGTEREVDPFIQSGSDHGNSWFMPERLFRKMERPSSIIGAGNDMLGYGMGLYSTVSRGNIGSGHDGGIDEYLSSFACYHDAGVAYYFTITTMDGQAAGAITEYMQETLLEEIFPVTENIPEHPENIEGWYSFGSYRLALARILHDLFDNIKIEVVDDTLRMSGFTGEGRNLVSLGSGYYRTGESPLPTHWLGEYDGKMVVSSSFGAEGGYYEKTGIFPALGKTWALIISINIFIITSLIYFINYMVVRAKKIRVNAMPMIWPALGFLCLVLVIVTFGGMTSVYLLATPNARSVTVAVFSALFAICLVGGLLSFRRGKTHRKPWQKAPLLLGYAAWIYIVLLLALYGHMPVTTWIW